MSIISRYLWVSPILLIALNVVIKCKVIYIHRFFEYRMKQVPCHNKDFFLQTENATMYGLNKMNNTVYNVIEPRDWPDTQTTAPPPAIESIYSNVSYDDGYKQATGQGVNGQSLDGNVTCWKWTEHRSKFGSNKSYKVGFNTFVFSCRHYQVLSLLMTLSNHCF